MKKTLLFILFAIFLFSSCENNPTDALFATQNQILKANINGSDVVFDHTKVVKETITEDGEIYTDLVVTANKKNDTSSQILFRLEYLRTGANSCYYFLYKTNDAEHDIETDNSFAVNVTQNNGSVIKGNFSGTLSDFEGNTVTISNGKFDISF